METSASSEPGFVCPLPQKWNQIHKALDVQGKEAGAVCRQPPIPLVLAGWAYLSDLEKAVRRWEMAAWAAERGIGEAVSAVGADEQYRSDR